MTNYPRIELFALIRICRDRGLTNQQTAEELGVSRSQVGNAIWDPDGSKQKAIRQKYRKPCPQCGTLMDGSNGHAKHPRLCQGCAKLPANNPTVVWTPDTIIATFYKFHQITGRTPTVTDMHGKSPSIMQRLSPERQAEILANPVALPHPNIARKHFGSWHNAVQAAGLTPAKTGRPTHRVTSTP